MAPNNSEKKAYDMDYKRQHIFDKRVSFNDTNTTDMKLQFWAEHQRDKKGNHISFNAYVKSLIYDDMIKRQPEN